MTTVAPDLTVTVTEETTVFEGIANVRRHDHPSPAEIASYIRTVSGPVPQGTHVHVVAPEAESAQIVQALEGSGIDLSTEPAGRGVDHGDGEGRHALAVAVDADRGEAWWDDEPIDVARPLVGGADEGVGRWWPVAAVAAAAVLCGVAILGTVSALERGGGEEAAEASEPVPAEAPEPVSQPPTSPRPATAVITRGGLVVEVPAGFSVEPDGDMWRATGQDPNFRLQLAVDPLYQLPGEQLVEQVLREIEQDPQVELVSDDAGVVTYREVNPDGSQALWRTWTEAGNQLSIGCHSRYEPTRVQEATCRMAMDSAVFDADQAAG